MCIGMESNISEMSWIDSKLGFSYSHKTKVTISKDDIPYNLSVLSSLQLCMCQVQEKGPAKQDPRILTSITNNNLRVVQYLIH